jgi:hypothetical protein
MTLKLQRATQFFGDILPELINFDHIGLDKQKVYQPNGFIDRIKYAIPSDPQPWTDLVVEEIYTYVRDPGTGIPISRTTEINWYTDEDIPVIGFTKTFFKAFLPSEAIQEGNNRRSRLIDNAKAYLAIESGLSIGDSFDLLVQLKNEIDLYIGGYQVPLIIKLQDPSFAPPYLTQTIRDNTVAILNYE